MLPLLSALSNWTDNSFNLVHQYNNLIPVYNAFPITIKSSLSRPVYNLLAWEFIDQPTKTLREDLAAHLWVQGQLTGRRAGRVARDLLASLDFNFLGRGRRYSSCRLSGWPFC